MGCLHHASAGERRSFLQAISDGHQVLGDELRRLTVDRGLLDELLPAVDGLAEDLDFSDAIFPDAVDFGPVTFVGRVRFNGVRFGSDVCFSRATFRLQARFNGASFGGEAIFGGTREYLHGEWLGDRREGTVFAGRVEFVGSHFVGAARFDWVRFGGDVTFANAQFESEFRHEEAPSGALPADRTIALSATRFRAGASLDLPPGQVLAAGMDIGAPSRLKLRGPLDVDHVTLTHPLTIVTASREEVSRLREHGSAPEIRTVAGATLQAPLIVGAGISLARCDMSGTVGLDHLTLDAGTSPLALHRGRRVLYDEIDWRQDDRRRGRRLAEAAGARLGRSTWAMAKHRLDGRTDAPPRRLDPGPIAARYRQLRQGLEQAKNAPGSADFYFGEMEMRRAASTNRYERFYLWLYWIVSGYGLRASRSIAAYVAVVVAATAAFRYGPPGLHTACPSQTCADLDDWWSTLVFLVRWSLSVFPAPETLGLSTSGQAILLLLRVVSPILLALTVLAVRARVHR